MRKLQYEQLEHAPLSGILIDIGGGQKALYQNLLPKGLDYSSANIDPDIQPTFLVKPGEKIPAKAGSFDCCLSMNTLEHVYDPVFLLKEMLRLLKPGGTAFIFVPWMFRIHAHPDDYGRYTPSWWQLALGEAGFSRAEITPLVWGRFSTAAEITGFRVFKAFSKHYVHFKDIVYAALFARSPTGRYSNARGKRIANVALAYYIAAKK